MVEIRRALDAVAGSGAVPVETPRSRGAGGRSSMKRLILVALLSACERTDMTPEERCKVRFAEYEARSGDAWRDDALAASGTVGADLTIMKTGDELPTREVLNRLKAHHAAAGGPSPAWQAAYVATERAIAACGEGARRPPT